MLASTAKRAAPVLPDRRRRLGARSPTTEVVSAERFCRSAPRRDAGAQLARLRSASGYWICCSVSRNTKTSENCRSAYGGPRPSWIRSVVHRGERARAVDSRLFVRRLPRVFPTVRRRSATGASRAPIRMVRGLDYYCRDVRMDEQPAGLAERGRGGAHDGLVADLGDRPRRASVSRWAWRGLVLLLREGAPRGGAPGAVSRWVRGVCAGAFAAHRSPAAPALKWKEKPQDQLSRGRLAHATR
jgi:hypothetical protein